MSEAPGAARPRRLPLSLILDDCAPINAAYFMHPEQEHVLSIPNSFADEFAAVCETHGVLGKYSVLPMPSGAGRIDRRVSYVAPSDLERFLDIVRSRLAVRFDITAEILTHLAAYDIDNDRLLHRYEDEWIATASVAEMVRYISLALTILNNVGLPANGVTSCWRAGMSNEEQFARAIGEAQYAVNGGTFTWYFMHMDVRGRPRDPFVAWQDRERGILSRLVDLRDAVVPAALRGEPQPLLRAGAYRVRQAPLDLRSRRLHDPHRHLQRVASVRCDRQGRALRHACRRPMRP